MSQWLPPRQYSPIRWGLEAKLDDFRSAYKPEAESLSYSE